MSKMRRKEWNDILFFFSYLIIKIINLSNRERNKENFIKEKFYLKLIVLVI